MSNFGRQPFEIIEIEVPKCSLTYGSSPCTAALGASYTRPNGVGAVAGSKCYNCFYTCQDPDNYDGSDTFTLRYCTTVSTIPTDEIYYPALVSTTLMPTEIGIGSVDRRATSLGKRARGTVTLRDFRDNGAGFDPYLSGRYDGTAQDSGESVDPYEKSTHFAKLVARWPYYYGAKLTHKIGFVDDMSGARGRSFVITKFDGPDSSGRVTIEYQDPLILADKTKALVPNPNYGQISAAISDSGTPTVTLSPTGIGSTYSSSGYVRIGDEVMGYTLSGDDLTITSRARFNTEAEAHDADDGVQECYYANGEAYEDAIEDLLTNYASIDSSYITKADWADEFDTWLPGATVTRIITEPRSVYDELELMMNSQFVMWWDELDSQIRVRVLRPANTTDTTTITDNANMIEGSLRARRLDEQRISQAWASNAIKDANKNPRDLQSYKRTANYANLESETAQQYNQQKIYQIQLPWLGLAGDQPFASSTAERIQARLTDPPKVIEFLADVKDFETLKVGSYITPDTHVFVDENGDAITETFLVLLSEEIEANHRLKVKAQTFIYSGRFGGYNDETTASANYNAADDTERNTYAFYADETEDPFAFDDGRGPYVYF